ncbi:type IVB secretion system protein IcmH/DotU [Pseudomonas sp. 5FOS]|uniref:type IVB secretion system protein IcmH/DotU n=1 Tax=unclassified Pseudomonas TaxID=196821 RepID=UPI001A9E0163|nr:MULTISPECIES: type IVB secretion system protein IcmH/DotU [unclassified Pseudomonas]MCE5987365.1 type IVB secretion system protein IcmH/DotU [Pseudomonas sp. LM20]MCE5992854.1 type IVB secretion system protein IcmH/DotU [Pseudomonas sp. KCA11]
MPGPSAVPPGKFQSANTAHDVTENSLHAMLDVPEGTDSPYPPGQGRRAGHEGYPADPDFQLRGGFANLMLDAANPLFGLVMRLRTLDDLPNIEYVHKTLQTQVSAIREEIQQHGYSTAHLEVYSYALCLYLDEAVMSRPWGNNSCWSQEPLLSIFHDETHGGEKIFLLLERMMQSPEEFQDVLEFLYFCFCLGLKGKYALDPKCDEIINALISRMHRVIRELRGPAPEFPGDDPYTNVVHRPHRMRRWEWPWWSPLVISAIAMVCAYCYYSYRLSLITAEVLESLNGILQQ